ncbi:MAG: putative sugar phosphate isomerase YwlF [Planctomycetota bacterium]|jgi:ribose 5-phosphate isomerase B|nr:RpiB/LacA/LacB family sugar-phosphate isomerase [Planctomycetaceae bacterium]
MKIAMASDHAGLVLKDSLKPLVAQLGHEIVDVGAHTNDPLDDYPDFALLLGQAIVAGKAQRGLLFCGSGIGASVAANKITGIRAGNCTDHYSAHQGVEHDDMNVLVIGGRIVGGAVAEEMVRAFLAAKFTGEPRHQRRLDKVLAIERTNGR